MAEEKYSLDEILKELEARQAKEADTNRHTAPASEEYGLPKDYVEREQILDYFDDSKNKSRRHVDDGGYEIIARKYGERAELREQADTAPSYERPERQERPRYAKEDSFMPREDYRSAPQYRESRDSYGRDYEDRGRYYRNDAPRYDERPARDEYQGGRYESEPRYSSRGNEEYRRSEPCYSEPRYDDRYAPSYSERQERPRQERPVSDRGYSSFSEEDYRSYREEPRRHTPPANDFMDFGKREREMPPAPSQPQRSVQRDNFDDDFDIIRRRPQRPAQDRGYMGERPTAPRSNREQYQRVQEQNPYSGGYYAPAQPAAPKQQPPKNQDMFAARPKQSGGYTDEFLGRTADSDYDAVNNIKNKDILNSIYDDEDDDIPVKAVSKKAKNNTVNVNFEGKKAKKQAEIPEEKDTDDYVSPEANAVYEQLDKNKAGLIIRFIVSMLMLAGVLYFFLASAYGLALPGFLKDPQLMTAVSLAMVAVSAAVSANVVGGGIISLLKLKPNNDVYTALTVFACLLQGTYVLMQPQLMTKYSVNIYMPIAAAMLTLNAIGKLIMHSRIENNFDLVSANRIVYTDGRIKSSELSRHLASEVIADSPRVIFAKRIKTFSGYMDAAFSKPKCEEISKFLAPLSFLSSLLIALVSYLFTRNIFASVCIFTGAVCMSSPIAAVIASQIPLSIINTVLFKQDAAICGYEGCEDVADSNAVILNEDDLFPKGTVRLKNIKVFGRNKEHDVIECVAALLSGFDTVLYDVFSPAVKRAAESLVVENTKLHEGEGFSGWINRKRVLLGTRSFLNDFNIALPDMSEELMLKSKNCEIFYMSCGGTVTAIFSVEYRADKRMMSTMGLMCDNDIAVCARCCDPFITKQKILEIYNFPPELMVIVPNILNDRIEGEIAGGDDSIRSAAFTTVGGIRAVLSARRCERTVSIELAMLLISVLIGFAIVAFFAFTKQIQSLTWVTMLAYHCTWMLAQILVAFVIR